MPFTQTNVNYAAEYGQAMAEAYPYLSYFGEIWASPLAKQFMPGKGKTVYIPTLDVKGAHAADRDNMSGQFTRNFNNSFVAKTLEMDSEWDTLTDPMDMEETNDVAILANISREFNQMQKVPEMDAYLAAKLLSFVTTPDTTAITSGNVLTLWDTYLQNMSDARVPLDRIHAYVTPAVYTLLKQTAGVSRFIDVGGAGQGQTVNRNVKRLDEIPVHIVPSDIMKSSFVFTEGWVPASGAKQINMILVDPMAVAAPVKYETAMMSAPTAQSKGKYLYYERYYYGAFAMPKREGGIFVNVAA